MTKIDSVKTSKSNQSLVRDYYDVTKPNVITLLVFTGAASYVAAAGWHTGILQLVLVSVSIWLGSAGADTVGSYFDRDIDAIMKRTSSRPIPTGRIPPRNAAEYGLALLAAQLAHLLLLESNLRRCNARWVPGLYGSLQFCPKATELA